MLYHRYFDALGLHFIRAADPFTLEELISLQTNSEKIPPETVGRPVLIDFRSVSLSSLDPADIRRHLMKKSALDPAVTQVACAYLVGNDADYAVVRMANVLSELSGINPESRSFITEIPGDALNWLAGWIGAVNSDALDDLQQAMKDHGTCGP